MLKKTSLVVLGLLLALVMVTPPKANAGVVVGVGVGPVYPVRPYGYGRPYFVPRVGVYAPAWGPAVVAHPWGYYGRPYPRGYWGPRPYAYRYGYRGFGRRGYVRGR